MLLVPAARQMAMSSGCSGANRKMSRKAGTVSTNDKKTVAPPRTHHIAPLGIRKVLKKFWIRERLLRINPKLAMISVV